jgi:hypothetical protein
MLRFFRISSGDLTLLHVSVEEAADFFALVKLPTKKKALSSRFFRKDGRIRHEKVAGIQDSRRRPV